MTGKANDDVLIVGGGVIGLSLAYELLARGAGVRLLERGRLGREASWAGAGILPPARLHEADHPYEQLAGLSLQLHARWAARLLEETGVDTGYRPCGGVYLARSAGEAAALRGLQQHWSERGIELRRLEHDELKRLGLQHVAAPDWKAAYFAPDEASLRNPRHLQALAQACRRRGGALEEEVEVTSYRVAERRVVEVVTNRGTRTVGRVCLCGGAWSGAALRDLGVTTGLLPVRGQMVLFGAGSTGVRCVVNEGSRYLVPRDDGRLLAGSTEEEVGFDKRTTEEAVADLTALARAVLPELRARSVERSWAGLRPATFDGFPYLGRLPGLENAFVAAGHFRSGILLSTGTAQAMADLLTDQQPPIDLAPFRPARG